MSLRKGNAIGKPLSSFKSSAPNVSEFQRGSSLKSTCVICEGIVLTSVRVSAGGAEISGNPLGTKALRDPLFFLCQCCCCAVHPNGRFGVGGPQF